MNMLAINGKLYKRTSKTFIRGIKDGYKKGFVVQARCDLNGHLGVIDISENNKVVSFYSSEDDSGRFDFETPVEAAIRYFGSFEYV